MERKDHNEEPAGTAGRMGAQQAGLGRPAGGPTWPMPLPREESPRDLGAKSHFWSRSRGTLTLASEATPGKWVHPDPRGRPGAGISGVALGGQASLRSLPLPLGACLLYTSDAADE